MNLTSGSFGRPGRRTAIAVVGTGLVVAAVGFHRMWFAPQYQGRNLPVSDAFEEVSKGRILLVDIRRPDEWTATGLPRGAHALDMRRDDFTAALTALAGADTTRPIALICARGVRSARLATRLADAGYAQIINVPEGMLGSPAGPGWLAAGLPVEPHPEPAE